MAGATSAASAQTAHSRSVFAGLEFGAESLATLPDPDSGQLYDLNGDGAKDIATITTTTAGAGIAWLERSASGWTRHEIAPPGTHRKLEGLAVADFDQDGEAEVVVADQFAYTLSVYRPAAGDPSGSWTGSPIRSGIPYRYVHDVSSALDIDGDGVRELLVSTEGRIAGEGSFRWLNLSAGGDPLDGGDWTAHTIAQIDGAWAIVERTADFSGSERGDLLVSARSYRNIGATPGIYWLEGPSDPAERWTVHPIESRPADWLHLDVGDFSGDGNGLDVIASDLTGTYGPGVYRYSDGWSRTELPDPAPGQWGFNLRRWNIPGLPRSSILYVASNSGMFVLAWDGSRWEASPSLVGTSTHPADGRIESADLDRDGYDELYAFDSGGGQILELTAGPPRSPFPGSATEAATPDAAVAPPDLDGVAPETTITRRPPSTTARRRATLAFESGERRSTFECKRGPKAWSACRPPLRLRVSRGRNRFAVRAIDSAGNADPTPASCRWRVTRAR